MPLFAIKKNEQRAVPNYVADYVVPSSPTPTSTVAERINARAPTPEQRAELEKTRKEALASVDTSSATRNLLSTVNDDSFNLKLSKHLDDYRRGRGYLSNSVVGELYNRSGKTASTLAAEDPSAASRYNSYSTGFDYESRARFIQGLSGAASTASELRSLARRLNEKA